MNRLSARRLFLLFLLTPAFLHSQKWTAPTPEELSMTVQPEVPDADAVYLYREELTDDREGTYSFYYRIKVLRPKGADLAKFVLVSSMDSGGRGSTIHNVNGRTIDPDGTILPMKERPVEETIAQPPGGKRVIATYTLPQPKVGSILEYQYTRHFVSMGVTPAWALQNNFFTRKAHFLWRRPTLDLRRTLWTFRLPDGADIKTVVLGDQGAFQLDVNNVPPLPKEEDQPPLSHIRYRVDFYLSREPKEEFWKEQGQFWSKNMEQFIGQGPGVKAAVAKLVSSSDTPEQKLRKLYQAVMDFDNLTVDREQGGKQVNVPQAKSTEDILSVRRGNNDQIADLFIAMARAAGFTAYAMRVANRDHFILDPDDRTLAQMDDNIAVVNLGGKELFLDPGTRFCPFNHLSPKHSGVMGLRQTGGGTELASTPVEPPASFQFDRIANLKMDEQGRATGIVRLTYVGTAGIYLRQIENTKGESALNDTTRDWLSKHLPAGMDVEITSIENLKDYESPLTIVANIKGTIASPEGNRLSVKSSFFDAQSEQQFKSAVRNQPVYLDGSCVTTDAVRINLPSSITAASKSSRTAENLNKDASYQIAVEADATSLTIRRSFTLGRLIYPVSDYPDLRSFFAKMYSKDQELIDLTHASAN